MHQLNFRWPKRSGWRDMLESPMDEQPLRGELLSLDLLKQFARGLAQDRRVGKQFGPNRLLHRLTANERILRESNEQTLRSEKHGVSRLRPSGWWIIFT